MSAEVEQKFLIKILDVGRGKLAFWNVLAVVFNLNESDLNWLETKEEILERDFIVEIFNYYLNSSS